jgi:hypothetical protein
MHPRSVLERVSDEADFEQIDILEHAAFGGLAREPGTIAEA